MNTTAKEVNQYQFTPEVDSLGIYDYTGVEPNKIQLPNKNTILSQDLPSYLPPVHIRRNMNYDIPAFKVSDNEYLLRESDTPRKSESGQSEKPRLYRVSLDVYAALVQYHLQFDRAAFSLLAQKNNEARLLALSKGEQSFKRINERSLPIIPCSLEDFIIQQSDLSTVRNLHNEEKPSRVVLKKSKSKSMSVEPYYFINSIDRHLSKREIFRMHETCLDDIRQKIIDIEAQQIDYESSWTKGRETSYGDSNVNTSLLSEYGVLVKRQNGDYITDKEIKEIADTLSVVHSVYGDLSGAAREFNLKISHAGTTRMHASKFIGLFSSYHRAIGISFPESTEKQYGVPESILTASHEYAHFLDHISGKSLQAWYASDIPGTTENKIAVSFRQHMTPIKGNYWSRTCECFARAMQEYTQITLLKENNPEMSYKELYSIVSKDAFVSLDAYEKHILPLVETVLSEYKQRFVSHTVKSLESESSPEITEKLVAATKENVAPEIVITDYQNRSFTQLELFDSGEKRQKTIAPWQEQLDQYLENGIKPKGNIFSIPWSPELQYNAQIPEAPIHISVSVIKKARSVHHLTNDEIRESLHTIHNPVLIFDSNPETTEAKRPSLLFISDESTSENKPVAIALELSKIKSKETVHEIRSIHGRQLIAQNNANVLEEWVQKGLLRYVDTKKISEWQRRERVYFPMSFANSDIDTLIETGAVVNTLPGIPIHTDTYFNQSNQLHTITVSESDPELSRDHLHVAKGMMKTLVRPVLSGDKTGLWTPFRKFKQHGVFDIQGSQVATENGVITNTGWKQLATAMSIYRDKRFETFRVLYISENGEIADQVAVSSHLPDRVSLAPIMERIDEINQHAQRTQTKVVIAHNHPSGNVNPSEQDKLITQILANQLPLLGHIILDHNSFGLCTDTLLWVTELQETWKPHDPLMKARNPALAEMSISNQAQLEYIARQINEEYRWNSTDWSPIVFTSTGFQVTGLRYYKNSYLDNISSEKLLSEFQKTAVQNGFAHAFPVVVDGIPGAEVSKFIRHYKNGCFTDFYINGLTSQDFHLEGINHGLFNKENMRTHKNNSSIESTFALEEKKDIVQKTEEAVASKDQGEYGGQERNDNLFKMDTSPGFLAALASISKADVGKPNTYITVSEKTPFVLTLNGLPDKEVTMYRDKLARALYLEPVKPGQRFQHGHSDGLDKNIIQKVFNDLANPYYIFASKDGVSLVGVYDINDKNGEPVIIAFNYNTDRNGVEANWVKSLYGKKEQGIERWAEEGLLRYANDKEKATELSITLQMRVMGSSAAYDKNIIHKSEIVNTYSVRSFSQDYTTYTSNRNTQGALIMGKETNNSQSIAFSFKVSDRFVQMKIDDAEWTTIGRFPDTNAAQQVLTMLEEDYRTGRRRAHELYDYDEETQVALDIFYNEREYSNQLKKAELSENTVKSDVQIGLFDSIDQDTQENLNELKNRPGADASTKRPFEQMTFRGMNTTGKPETTEHTVRAILDFSTGSAAQFVNSDQVDTIKSFQLEAAKWAYENDQVGSPFEMLAEYARLQREQEAFTREQEVDSFEHDGIKVYKTRIKQNNGEYTDYWAVQNENNVGTSRVAYDTLHESVEAAKKGAATEKIERERRAERKIQDEIAEKELSAEREQDDLRKVKNRNLSISERKANAYLEKELPRRVYEGRTAEQHMELDEVYIEKVETDHSSSFNRTKYNRMDYEEQQEYERKLKMPKTEYRMYTTQPGRFFEIKSTLFNYLAEKYPEKVRNPDIQQQNLTESVHESYNNRDETLMEDIYDDSNRPESQNEREFETLASERSLSESEELRSNDVLRTVRHAEIRAGSDILQSEGREDLRVVGHTAVNGEFSESSFVNDSDGSRSLRAGSMSETESSSDRGQSEVNTGSFGNGYVSPKTLREIRSECIHILESKKDSEITEKDRILLAQYEGAGGLGEKEASAAGVLSEFYTPEPVIQSVWRLVDAYHPDAQTVLEPSAGTGRFAHGRNEQFTLHELDETSSRIARLLHPEATVITGAFQKQFFDPSGRVLKKGYTPPTYDVVVGNPPYGTYTGKWKGLGEGKHHARYEEYFIEKGLDSLNPDGVLAFVVPSGFLRSGRDSVKEIIASKGTLLDAWRLPNGAFPTTEVGTDIIVMKRGMSDPDLISNDRFFIDHPEHIVGEETVRQGRFGQEQYIAIPDGQDLQTLLEKINPIVT